MKGRFLITCLLVAVGCGKTNNDNAATQPDATVEPDAFEGCGVATCASQGATCGKVGDGCGGTLECGSCSGDDTCGGGGTYFQCGHGGPACTPRSCTNAGAECGVVSDGCGGVTEDCGTCPGNDVCGGDGVANKCATPACTGLCAQQDACTSGTQKTRITGIVTAPGHDDTATWGAPDPIYGALVYVPNGAIGAPTYGVTSFPAGVTCDSCSSLVSGSPLVTATTGVDGSFTIDNAPCGTDIPLVIQLGRWRRQITIPSVACCADTTLTNAQTHLPRSRVGETGDLRSDIPLMAFSTGSVDILHCVLRKMGVADTEFTNPGGDGRVQLFKDNGAKIDANTPAASTLYGSASELAKYDMVLFECVGNPIAKAAADQQRVVDYANAGGRIFATHFSYTWLTNSDTTAQGSTTTTGPNPWSQTADFDTRQGNVASLTALVDQTEQGDLATQARRIAFAQWLLGVGASTTAGEIPVNVARHDMNSINATPATKSGTPAQQWLYASSPFSGPVHYTFDTPVSYGTTAPATQCGRVLFSDFHVSDASVKNVTFPTECSNSPMTPQEKTLEFMLFDLASCVGPPLGACTPKTCAEMGVTCGKSGDGCDDGVVLDCGACQTCTPRTCAEAGAQCGIIGDGCGGTVDCTPCFDNICEPCPDGGTCGGGGTPNQCGAGPIL
jgi:hypothetical protein